MWKKEDEQGVQPQTAGSRVASPAPATTGKRNGQATIGPSISIKGDVTGSEDLLIEGEITGSVSLGDHAVGVGRDGRVKADVVGRLITVEGRVEGDLTAQEQIVLRNGANVKGDIKAPRVVLEDGATFRGLVDMGTAPESPDAKTTAADASMAEGASAGGSPKSGKGDGSGNGAESSSVSGGSSKSSSGSGASSSSSSSSGSGSSKQGSSARKSAGA